MFDAAIRPLLDVVGQHPVLATFVVFLAALSEAIPVVGAVVPGTAVVIGLGALVGLGHLPLWPILSAAALGAIAGDGISYWFGHRYKGRALDMWPLSRHPGMVETSERFFVRHGAKSIAIARFTPVVRAFVPLLAGVSGMSPGRFYAANVASALAWAPLHVLPGAALGASLGALGAVSGRTLALLALVAFAAVALTWLASIGWRAGSVTLGRLQDWLFVRLSGREGRLAGFAVNLLDRDKPSVRGVALLGSLLAAVVLVFVNVVEGVLAQGELTRADAAIANLVTGLRSAWSDRALVFVTTLADTPITGAVGLAAAAWLAWLGRGRLALGIVALVAATTAFALGLKATTHILRPNPIYAGAVEFSFPSGHVTFATAIYGALCWLVARDFDRPWRTLALFCVGGLIATVAVSRIYLGAHWPSDVTAGLLYGTGAIAVFALVFRSVHLVPRERLTTMAAVLAALTLIGGWHVTRSYALATARYAPAVPIVMAMSEGVWRDQGWQRLPTERVELGGDREDALLLQWAGSAPALAASLASSGWRQAPDLGLATLDRYLTGSTAPDDLPVLPKLNEGKAPELALVRSRSPAERQVLRVWTSHFAIGEGAELRPILVASITRESIEHPLGLLTVSRKRTRQPADSADFAVVLPNFTVVVRPPTGDGSNSRRAQTVLAAP